MYIDLLFVAALINHATLWIKCLSGSGSLVVSPAGVDQSRDFDQGP